MVALGLAQRPDLLALVATADPTDRKTLNDLCGKAAEHGGATQRRDLGTALHSMLERAWFDAGYRPPEQWAGDVDAVRSALEAAGLEPMPGLAERIVVDDERRIAGTFDLAVRDRTGRLLVADIKTGSSVAYGSLAWAIQLAIYAGADALYDQGQAADGSEDRREPMPAFDQGEAVIVHVQPGSGRCDLHRLDLEVGRRGLELAVAVREIRRARPLTALDMVPEVHDGLLAERTRWLTGRVAAIVAATADAATCAVVGVESPGHLLAALWPAGAPTMRTGGHSAEQLDRIAAVCSEVEARFGLPFGDLDPAVEADIALVPADDERVVEMVSRLRALPPDLLDAVEARASMSGATVKVALGLPLRKLHRLDEIVTDAERVAGERMSQIRRNLGDLGAADADVVAGVVAPGVPVERFTARHARLFDLVTEAVVCAFLVVTDGQLVVHPEAAERLLVVHATKTAAVTHTRRVAQGVGLAAPRSFAEVCSAPLLVACAVGDDPDADRPAA